MAAVAIGEASITGVLYTVKIQGGITCLRPWLDGGVDAVFREIFELASLGFLAILARVAVFSTA